jgi:RNA polymerase sigma factor (sigma-70 family)
MAESGLTTQSTTKWSSSEESFARFLTWLADGRSADGQEYLNLRSRLVAYFERKGCLSADDLADETLERVNRRLDEAGQIEVETPAKFCYITAKFVFLEYLRTAKRKESSIDAADLERIKGTDDRKDESERKEKLGRCLDGCLSELSADDRSLIVDYYFGERRTKIDHRRALAERHGISPNALAIRACRIRERLERCIKKCA